MPTTTPPAAAGDLRDYLGIFRRRKWVIVTAVVVVTATSLVVSFMQDKVYRAKAEVLFQPSNAVAASRVDRPTLETQTQLIESAAVRRLAREKLPGAGDVSAFQVGESSVIEVSAESANPRRAAATVNAYLEAYIEYRRKQEIDNYLAAGAEFQKRIDELTAQGAALEQERQQALADISARHGLPIVGNEESDKRRQALADAELDALDARLGPRIRENQSQQAVLRQRLLDLQTQGQLSTGGAEVVSPAGAPKDPVRPDPMRDGLIGFGAGLFLGVALALSFDYLDESVKTKEALERATGSTLPVLATIPVVGGWKDRSDTELVAFTDPRAPATESYRLLRTAVNFLGVASDLKSLQITSPTPGEGKSTTTANLAVVMAEAGRQVIAIDCDLRHPRLHEFFGVDNRVGLTSVLLGESTLARALTSAPGIARLRVLPSGPLPPNPAEVLSSARFNDILHGLEEEGALVIVDTPPVLAFTDSTILAGSVDATLLVVAAGVSTRKQVQRAIEQLGRVTAPLLGTVLNEASEEVDLGYYGYYGHDGYQEETPPAPEKATRRQRRARTKVAPEI